MKVKISYDFVRVIFKIEMGGITKIVSNSKTQTTNVAVHYCILELCEANGYEKGYLESAVNEYICNVETNNDLTYTFEVFKPILFINITCVGGPYKYEFKNKAGEVIYYHVAGDMKTAVINYLNRGLSTILGFEVSLDEEHITKQIDGGVKFFKVSYERNSFEEDDATYVNPVKIQIAYDVKKDKYVLMYKECTQIISHSSFHSADIFVGFEKFDKVLDNFVNRIKILQKEEVSIVRRKNIYWNLDVFNKLVVKKVDKKNYNLKQQTNILGLE